MEKEQIHGRAPSANGGLKEPELHYDAEEWRLNMLKKMGLKDSIDGKLDRIEKAISEMVGANKVRAIYEYAAELSGNPCSPPGYDTATDEIPANLKQIIGNDILAWHLTAVIIEWAKLKGYGHSESKEGITDSQSANSV